jgi:hypothetical protein
MILTILDYLYSSFEKIKAAPEAAGYTATLSISAMDSLIRIAKGNRDAQFDAAAVIVCTYATLVTLLNRRSVWSWAIATAVVGGFLGRCHSNNYQQLRPMLLSS